MSGHKKALYNLAEGWLELESDPGLFTLLMEDMGVQGVQVEEIYDLQSAPLVQKKPCYGAIFLFRWIEDRRSRRKIVEEESLYVKDDEEINKIFFAQQIVPNSCATHALVSILLNCPQVNIGDTLMNLKNHVAGMNPENKGLAIGNSAQLAYAHNSHAVPRARRRFEKSNAPSLPGSRYTGEAFHFVSYVPINNRLFELDGLRRYPIDHGPIPDPDNWTEKLREVIQNRLGMSKGGVPIDIRFALMVLVPESRKTYQKKLRLLAHNRDIILKALKQLLEIYSAKKKQVAAESAKSSGRSTRSSNSVPKTYKEDDDIEFLEPCTSEEAFKIDKQVATALQDFSNIFKQGVTNTDVELVQGSTAHPVTKVKSEGKEPKDIKNDNKERITKNLGDVKKEENEIQMIDLEEKNVPAVKKNEKTNSDPQTETDKDKSFKREDKSEHDVVKDETSAEICQDSMKQEESGEKEESSNDSQLPGKLVNKPLLRVSRGSSAESCSQLPPLSPFQSNPLLTAHDYSKSPLMEGCEDASPPSCVEDDFEDVDEPDPLSSTEQVQADDVKEEDENSGQAEDSENSSRNQCDPDNSAQQSPVDPISSVSVEGSFDQNADEADEAASDADVDNDPLAIDNNDGAAATASGETVSVEDGLKSVDENGTAENGNDAVIGQDVLDHEKDPQDQLCNEVCESVDSETPHRWPLFSYSLEEDFPEFDPNVQILRHPSEFQPNDLLELLRRVEREIYRTEISMKDDMEQHNKFVIDDCRRVHDYDEFINTFLLMLAEQNMLADLVEHGLGFKRTKLPGSDPPPKSSAKKPGSLKCESVPASSSGSSATKVRKKKVKKRHDDSESDWSDEAPPQKQCKVMYHDPALPKGWTRRVKKRGGNLSHGKYTVAIISPEGKHFRTKGELRNYLVNQDSDLLPEQFDFSVSGNKRTNKKR